jgi:hypothetical protein
MSADTQDNDAEIDSDDMEDLSDDSSDDSDSDEGSSADEANQGVVEEDEDDDIVKAFKRAREVTRTKPPDIECEDPISDLSFHPEQNLIAAATLEGDILL